MTLPRLIRAALTYTNRECHLEATIQENPLCGTYFYEDAIDGASASVDDVKIRELLKSSASCVFDIHMSFSL